jgi:hypothetical protein
LAARSESRFARPVQYRASRSTAFGTRQRDQPHELENRVRQKGQSISDAIAERDVVAKRRDFLAGIADAPSTRQDRYSKSEVRFVATVSVGKLLSEVDQFAKRYRELKTRLQELNWKTELDPISWQPLFPASTGPAGGKPNPG